MALQTAVKPRRIGSQPRAYTTTRDLQDLVEMGALSRTGDRRHTRYWLALSQPKSREVPPDR